MLGEGFFHQLNSPTLTATHTLSLKKEPWRWLATPLYKWVVGWKSQNQTERRRN